MFQYIHTSIETQPPYINYSFFKQGEKVFYKRENSQNWKGPETMMVNKNMAENMSVSTKQV